MSSVRLKQDHNGHKKGAVISVPFAAGQTLVANGVGEYPTAPPAAGDPHVAAADRHAADIARLNAAHATALRDVREEGAAALAEQAKAHAAELAAARAELDAANKAVTDLQSKGKK